MVSVTDLFFEYIWNIDFSYNVENYYCFEVDSFSYVVIVDTYVFHYLCCELFIIA